MPRGYFLTNRMEEKQQVTKKEAGSNCSVLGVTWAGWRGGLAEQGAFILMWLIAK